MPVGSLHPSLSCGRRVPMSPSGGTGMQCGSRRGSIRALLLESKTEIKAVNQKSSACRPRSRTSPVISSLIRLFIPRVGFSPCRLPSLISCPHGAELGANPAWERGLTEAPGSTPGTGWRAQPCSHAFILFLDKESAQNCSRALNNKQLFGRVIKASIAIDNGRAAEFIRRRNYFDKSKCYECGEAGHLSYACPKNMLGEREPPKKKEKKKRKKVVEPEEIEEEEESEEEGEDPALDSLSQAIAVQQAKIEEEQQRWTQTAGESSVSDDSKRPRIKKSAYFSDEEELSD